MARTMRAYALDHSVLASGDACMFAHPNYALDRPLVRERTGIEEEIGFRVRSSEIEDPDFLLLSASENMGRARRYGDGADDVIMRE